MGAVSSFGRGARVLALVGAVVVAGLLLPGPASAGAQPGGDPNAAPDWSYDANRPIAEGDLVARSRDEGISREESLRRFRVEDAAAVLQTKAAARWPDSFAGLWLDRANFGVNVAFTRNAAANVDALRDDFPYPAELRALDRRGSLVSLGARQRRLGTDRGELQEGRARPDLPAAVRSTGGRYDLDIDVPAGNLVVRVEQATPDVVQGFRQAYGPDVVVEPGMAAPSACGQWDCRSAMMGGLAFTFGGGGYCSSAFSAYSGSTRFVLSAGHCYRDSGDQSRYNGGSLYGYTDRYSVGGNVDAERERKYNSAWRESGKFWVEGENPRMLDSLITYANMALNTYIGKSGARTASTRGYVLSKSVAPGYVPNSYNFISADFCVNLGDSGGAVWRSNTGWGIISGVFPNTSCRGTTGGSGAGRGIFGSIVEARNLMAVSILANVNLAPHAVFNNSCGVLLGCTFDAGPSYDEDGSITTYTWNFGDGKTGSGRSVSHTYQLPGTYTVKVTVKDNNGSTAASSRSITVL
jgi:streptogrisin C